MIERRLHYSGRVFLVLALAFGALTVWLLSRGYLSDFALHRWAKALTFADAPELRIEGIGLLYPHTPIYLLAAFSRVPGLDNASLPYLLATLAAAATLTLWNLHLAHKGYGRGQRWTLLALAASHPMLLWAVTSGLQNALTLLVFYLFAYGCLLVAQLRDVRSIIFVGVMLVLLFFTDERTSYIFLALLPLLPFLAPRRLMMASPLSTYALIAFPLLVAVTAWIYLNWIFHGNPWLFLEAPESSFRGAWDEAQSHAWLYRTGGGWMAPLGMGALIAVACFPATLWLIWRGRRRGHTAGTMLVLFAHLLVALAMASADFFLAHPASMLYLQSAVAMVCVLLAPRLNAGAFRILVGLLLAGSLGAALLLRTDETADMQRWRASFAGRQAEPFAADQRLGRWLAEHPAPTLIDDRAAFRAIAARGHARELLLPFDDRFKLALKHAAPRIEQVVVMDPRNAAAGLDRVTQRFPEFYRKGAPGFALVYDQDHWRVWRRLP